MFTVDKYARTPIYEQLIRQFEYRILSGDIPANGQLPSVRSLSRELQINPNTLQRAYAEIEQMGLCYSVAGSGRFISPDALERIRARAAAETGSFRECAARLRERGISEETLVGIIRDIYHHEGKAETV